MKFKRNTRIIPWKPVFISIASLVGLTIIIIYIILYNYDLNGLKPHISRIVQDATGRELVIGGKIHLRASLAPRVIIEDIALRNAQWGSRQNMIHAKRLKLQVALLPLLFNEIIVKQLIISEPDILLEIGHNGQTNFEFSKSSAEKDEKEIKKQNEWPVFGTKKIIIENGKFTYRNLRDEEFYTAKIKRLWVSGRDIKEPVRLKIYGLYNGQSISAEGTVGPLPALTDSGEKFTIHMRMKAGGNSLSIGGSIGDVVSMSDVAVEFLSEINNPAVIQRCIQRPFPIHTPFKLSGMFALSEKDVYQVTEFSLQSYDIDVEGSFALSLKGDQPKITAAIAAKKLNLKALMQASETAGRKAVLKKAQKKKAKVFPNDPLPLDWNSTVDADIQVKAGSVLLPDVQFHELSTNINLTAGRVYIDKFKARMGNGMLDGYFYLFPTKDMWRVKTAMKVEQLPLSELISRKKVTDSLEGNIDMVFSLTGRGKSIAEIVSHLNGDVGLSMCNGKIAKKYIDFLGVEFSSGLVKMINPFKEKADHTEVNCFVCILDVQQGIAKTKALVLDTGSTLTIGKGSVDFGTEKLNISLKPVPKEGIGIDKVGKISISFAEFYKPFKISGTLARPRLAIDLTQTAITLTKVAGGVALLGPAGVALALITGRIGDENPCLSAVEAVKQGSKEKGLTYNKKEGILEKTTNSIAERLKKLLGIIQKKPDKKELA